MPHVAQSRALIADAYRRRFPSPAFNSCCAEMARACITAEGQRAARALGVSKVDVSSALNRSLRTVWDRSSDAPSHRAVYARARAPLSDIAGERIGACGVEGRSEVVAP